MPTPNRGVGRGAKPGPLASENAKKGAITKAEMRRQQAAQVAADIRPEATDHDQLWVPVKDIFIDPAYVTMSGIEGYQREQRPGRIRQMAENFNPDYFGILTLSKRGEDMELGPNGETHACIDGGQRLGIYQYLGWLDDLIPANVYYGLTVAEEARMFVAMNRDRIAVLPMSIFMGKVTGSVQESVDLYNAITEAGAHIAVNMASEKCAFRAIVEAERVQKVAGTEVVHMAMLACVKAFGDDDGGISGKIFAAVAYLLMHFGRIINMTRLIDKLCGMNQDELLHQGKMLKAVGGKGQNVVHIATAISMEYNRNLRTNRLPDVPRSGWRKGSYLPDRPSMRDKTVQMTPHWQEKNGAIPTDEELVDLSEDWAEANE
jgi:hypothetical protein